MHEDRLLYAASTNALVLSDEEITQVKLLRNHAALALRRGDEDPESYQNRTRICNFAIAPHKRLPYEIWSLIFFQCLPNSQEIYSTSGKPWRRRAPWLLGRVCSTWRQVSRRDPRLWNESTIHVRSRSESDLQYACKILPPFVPITLKVSSLGLDAGTISMAIPYLWRVRSLDLCLSSSELMDLFRFSPSRYDKSLLSLESLFIKIHGFLMTKEAIASLDYLEPFRNTPNLQNFSFTNCHFPLAVLHIPWSQLRSLTIGDSSNISAFRHISKCSVLENLSLDIEKHNLLLAIERHFDVSANIIPISVQNFTLSGFIPRPILSSFGGLINMRHLDIRGANIDGNALYEVYSNGRRLTSICTSVPQAPHGVERLPVLYLPLLRKLELHRIQDIWLFDILRPSILEKVLISHPSCHVDLAAIQRMIAPSGSSLSSLVFAPRNSANFQWGNESAVFKFLSALSALAHLTINNHIFNEDSIEGIATGTLLPKIESLECSTYTDLAFFRMVEQRIPMASDDTKRTLKEARGTIKTYTLSRKELLVKKESLKKCNEMGCDIMISRLIMSQPMRLG